MSDQDKQLNSENEATTPAELSRRDMLKLGGSSAALTALTTSSLVTSSANAMSIPKVNKKTPASRGEYPKYSLGLAKKLEVNKAIAFNYPDENSPCTLIKFGKKVLGGVGPDTNIVAFSTLCSHQGCPVSYEESTGRLKCPCHFSLFDAEKRGQQICGQATASLPRILLSYDANIDQLSAIGVDGLIYGRVTNLL